MKKFNSIELGIPADMTYKGRTIKSLTSKTKALKSREGKKAVKLIPDNDNRVEIKDAGTVEDGKLKFGTAEVEIPEAVVKRGRKVATLTPKTKAITSRKGEKSIRVRGTKENKVSILSKGQEVAIVERILKKLDEAPIPKKDISALKAKFQMAFKRYGFKKAVEQMRDIAQKYAEKTKSKELSAEEVKAKNEQCLKEFKKQKHRQITDELIDRVVSSFKKYYYTSRGLTVRDYDGWDFQPYYFYLIEEVLGPKQSYLRDEFIRRFREYFERNTIFEERQPLKKTALEFIRKFYNIQDNEFATVGRNPEFSKELKPEWREKKRCENLQHEWHKQAYPAKKASIYSYIMYYIDKIKADAEEMIERAFNQTEAHKKGMYFIDFMKKAEKWWEKQPKSR
jgi:hypothetical protein